MKGIALNPQILLPPPPCSLDLVRVRQKKRRLNYSVKPYACVNPSVMGVPLPYVVVMPGSAQVRTVSRVETFERVGTENPAANGCC